MNVAAPHPGFDAPQGRSPQLLIISRQRGAAVFNGVKGNTGGDSTDTAEMVDATATPWRQQFETQLAYGGFPAFNDRSTITPDHPRSPQWWPDLPLDSK